MPTRILVIADDTFDSGDRVPTCIGQVGEVDQVHVVAPIIASPTDTLLEELRQATTVPVITVGAG